MAARRRRAVASRPAALHVALRLRVPPSSSCSSASLIALVAWLVGGLLEIGCWLAPWFRSWWSSASSSCHRGAPSAGGAPVGDLIEAAGRVEAGEVGTQVRRAGPARGPSAGARLQRDERAPGSERGGRRRLLADVSHELRTPLTVMQGTLEGMLDGLYPADQAHLDRSSRRPACCRAWSRTCARCPCPRRAACASTASRPTSRAAGGGRRRPSGPPTRPAYAHRRRRMTSPARGGSRPHPPGARQPRRERPALHALRRSITLGRGTGRGGHARVRDTGAGMEPDAVEHAFDRFYRSPGSTGTGLGLPIARNLVEAHGGRGLTSAPGAGTTVEVVYPQVA